jgi:glycerol-3-phosphate dehydrogenase
MSELRGYEVIIIGGGITGLGVAIDLALRGISLCLIEKDDLASGTTGRSHGLLHSGARYVAVDRITAIECNRENVILKKTMPLVIEDCGGLFISVSASDHEYKTEFLSKCKECQIPVEELSRREALGLEPNLNPVLQDAVLVPDAVIDPFLTVHTLASAAIQLGAVIKTYTEVIGFHKESGSIVSVRVRDRAGIIEDLRADVVVNAAGAYVNYIASMLGCEIPIVPDKGTLLVANSRLCNMVINRLRRPSDADIIVPHHTSMILGTTSTQVNQLGDLSVAGSEVQLIVNETSALVPGVKECRFLRAYAGIRPLLMASDQLGSDERPVQGRVVGRDYRIIDHGAEDGIENLVTCAGGKLTTFRLMAEKTADAVCKKLGSNARCETRKIRFDADDFDVTQLAKKTGLHEIEVKRLVSKHGSRVDDILSKIREDDLLRQKVCSCEFVLRAEVEHAIEQGSQTFDDIKRRTRLGMGSCQGGFCGYKLAATLVDGFNKDALDVHRGLIRFLENRWTGVRPVLWGDQLRQERLVEAVYSCVGTYDKYSGRDLEQNRGG